MKQSAFAVHLFVCGGDLVFSRGVSMWGFQHVPLVFCFPPALPFCSPPPSLHPSLRMRMCVCAPRPYECVTAVVCLFTFSPLSTFTRLRDLHWTWPWMPSFIVLPPLLSSPLLSRFLFVIDRFSELKIEWERRLKKNQKTTKSTRGQMHNWNNWQESQTGLERKHSFSRASGRIARGRKWGGWDKRKDKSKIRKKSRQERGRMVRCWAEMQTPSVRLKFRAEEFLRQHTADR